MNSPAVAPDWRASLGAPNIVTRDDGGLTAWENDGKPVTAEVYATLLRGRFDSLRKAIRGTV